LFDPKARPTIVVFMSEDNITTHDTTVDILKIAPDCKLASVDELASKFVTTIEKFEKNIES